MVSKTTPRNISQRAGKVLRIIDRFTGLVPIYTCPAGKQALITDLFWEVDAFGSNSVLQLMIQTLIPTLEKVSRQIDFISPIPDPNTLNDLINKVTLNAGEFLQTVGTGGTNHTCDLRLTVEEFGI